MIAYIGHPKPFRSPLTKLLDKLEEKHPIIGGKLADIDALLERAINFILTPISSNVIRVDNHDTWNADYTLAHIIHPILVRLKETKQGAPQVDNEDVPESLRATDEELRQYSIDGTTDPNYFKRYDYILDEMIWAFDFIKNEHKFDYISDDITSEWHRAQNGFNMFGKYYTSLWD